MIRTHSNGSTYKVILSVAMAAALKDAQREAEERGIGAASLNAIKTAFNWLRYEPLVFGEPTYHLYKLKLQLRTGVLWPIIVDYAVYQLEPLVFIKGVRLLS